MARFLTAIRILKAYRKLYGAMIKKKYLKCFNVYEKNFESKKINRKIQIQIINAIP